MGAATCSEVLCARSCVRALVCGGMGCVCGGGGACVWGDGASVCIYVCMCLCVLFFIISSGYGACAVRSLSYSN